MLPDCCEDFILEYGDFYAPREEFSCPECGNGWQKLEGRVYGLRGTEKTFERRERHGPAGSGTSFAYLSSLDGHNPIIDRCCTKLLLRYGPTLRAPALRCPICRTEWTPVQVSRGGMRVACFRTDRLSDPLALQRSRTRSFLVPLSAYTLPVE
ncbi:MAG: hypothetical protein NVSMB65_10940 [Chloroflexota bacterium]